MLDVSIHCQSRQTARAKQDVQAQFSVSITDTDSTDHSPKQVFKHHPKQLMSSINSQTLSINIQQCENVFFLNAAVISIHFLHPVQGRFSWKPYIVLIKNKRLNYCRSSLNLKSTLCIHSTYFNCLLWGVIDMQRKETNNLLKILQYGDMGGDVWAPPGGGEGTWLPTIIFQSSSCKSCIQTSPPRWEKVFGILGTTSANVHYEVANALMFNEKMTKKYWSNAK